MHYSIRQIILALIPLAVLTGCSALEVAFYSHHPDSGVASDQLSTLSYIYNARSAAEYLESLPDDSELSGALDGILQSCGPEIEPQFALPAGLIAAAGKLTFDLAVDAISAKSRRIAEHSLATYSVNLVIDKPTTLPDSCIVFTRGTDSNHDGKIDPNGENLVIAMKVSFHENSNSLAYILKPIFIRIDRSIAWTRTKSGDEAPKVDLAIAVSIDELYMKADDPVIEKAGIGSFKIEGLPFDSAQTCQSDMGTLCTLNSTMIPKIRGSTSAAIITVAITETGVDAPASERALAELKALREAMGPEIKTFIKDELD